MIENVSVPPEVEAAIDKRGSMAAIGNLNDYIKLQMAQSLTLPGGNAGSFTGSFAGVGAGLGAGLTLGQQFASALNQPQATPAAAAQPVVAAPSAPAAPLELLGTADLAKVLGVSEADVTASLEKGDIKGKKIGSTWRVTRTALDEFLKS